MTFNIRLFLLTQWIANRKPCTKLSKTQTIPHICRDTAYQTKYSINKSNIHFINVKIIKDEIHVRPRRNKGTTNSLARHLSLTITKNLCKYQRSKLEVLFYLCFLYYSAVEVLHFRTLTFFFIVKKKIMKMLSKICSY